MINNRKKRIKSDFCKKYYLPYIYNRLIKEYPAIDQKLINAILTRYFELAEIDLTDGNDVNLPGKLGMLTIRMKKCEVYYDEEKQKMVNTFPINIGESVKLWKDKPELRGKRFVRYTNEHSNQYQYNLSYSMKSALYKNKNVYSFQFCKTLKSKLNDNIINKKIQCFVKI